MLIKLQFWKWIKSTLETQYLCVSPLEPPTKVKSEHHEAITKFWCRNEPPDSTIIQTGGFLSIPVCSQFKQDEITLENHRRLRNPACPAYWELFHCLQPMAANWLIAPVTPVTLWQGCMEGDLSNARESPKHWEKMKNGHFRDSIGLLIKLSLLKQYYWHSKKLKFRSLARTSPNSQSLLQQLRIKH